MKKTCTLHSIVTTLFLCNFAQAGVVLVEDSSTKDGYYMAKVINVKPIIEKVPYMTTKNYCQKQYGITHYSGPGTSTLVLGMTPPLSTPICKLVNEQVYQSVIKGYQVTYDFKGTLKTAILNNEPSEFVQVYNAP
jgi:uncharacterized protein YcfJ